MGKNFIYSKNFQLTAGIVIIGLLLIPASRRIYGWYLESTQEKTAAAFLDSVSRRSVVPAEIKECKFKVPEMGQLDDRGNIGPTAIENLGGVNLPLTYLSPEIPPFVLKIMLGSVETPPKKEEEATVKKEGDLEFLTHRKDLQASVVLGYPAAQVPYYCWVSVTLQPKPGQPEPLELSPKIQELAEQIGLSLAAPAKP